LNPVHRDRCGSAHARRIGIHRQEGKAEVAPDGLEMLDLPPQAVVFDYRIKERFFELDPILVEKPREGTS